MRPWVSRCAGTGSTRLSASVNAATRTASIAHDRSQSRLCAGDDSKHGWLSRLLAMDGQLATGLFKGGDVLESADRQTQVEFGEEGAKVVRQALSAAVRQGV